MNELEIVDSMTAKTPVLAVLREPLLEAVRLICRAFERGGQLFIAGNGGSMSDALHISGELLKAFQIERRGFLAAETQLQPGVPVWVLGNNPSLVSAVDNDLKPKGLGFAQELFAAGREGDVLLGISTSGRAGNVMRAFEVARRLGIRVLSLTGDPGGPMASFADLSLKTPGADTAEIQEYHLKVYHALCAAIESRLFGERGTLSGPYRSRYAQFDFSRIRTYPLAGRANRTAVEGLVSPSDIGPRKSGDRTIAALAEATVAASRASKPVIVMMGAHLIKNGLGPLVVDLIERRIISLAACNGACPIHDVELALCGGTSEKVPVSLPEGQFGFARETGLVVNGAYREAYKRKMGAGEALGAILAGEIDLQSLPPTGEPGQGLFPFKSRSLFYGAYRCGVPVTVHATMGTDIVDQHPGVSFEAKGFASGIDFAIFAQEVTRLAEGGVVLNVGGAVTQPEVFLKAVSMAANVGRAPAGFTTAVFDLYDFDPEDVEHETRPGYYRRDIKSVVVRIPRAFGGKGVYVQGDQRETWVDYYAHVKYLLQSRTPC